MKKECRLCLKVYKSLDCFINIYAEEWKKYNIESEIEQHLWPMASLKSKSSWLCSSCWLAVHAFHQFYRRIEDVQTNFEDAVKCDNDQKKENKFLQNITAITELDETEIDIQQLLKARDDVFKEHEPMGIDDRSTKTDRNYKCPKCHQKLNDKKAVKSHMAWHGGTRISCEICDLIFIDKYELIKHKKIHVSSDKSNNVVLSCNPDEQSTFKRISNDEVDTETNSNELAYECSYSSKVFESELPATEHKSSHVGDMWFICEICYLTFSDLDQYEIHKALHEPPNVNNVTPFTSPQMMEESSPQMMEESSTEAEVNTIDFKEVKEKVKDDADYSISSVESKCMKQFQCEYCSKKFLYKRNYIKHIARHKLLIAKANAKFGKNASDSNNSNNENIRVKDQPTIIENIVVQDLDNHSARSKSIDGSNLLKENFRCKFCFRELETEQALLSHKAWHEGNLLQCSICDLTFFNKTDFKNHQLVHEQFPPEPDLQDEEEEGYKCTVCYKVLNSRRLYINHNAWHLGTIYRCDVCDLKFLDKVHLDAHSESHIPKDWKRCRECRQPFSSATEVLRHYDKVHKNPVQNVCHVCGKSYRCPVSFKHHVDKHNGIPKMLPCKICGRLLTNRMGLHSHMLINHPEGGKFPYACNICLKPLPTRAKVNAHIRLYHDTTGYDKNCKICNVPIKNLRHFLCHSATHNSFEKYSCQWCDEKFNERKKLYRHRLKIHPTEYEEWRKEQYVQD